MILHLFCSLPQAQRMCRELRAPARMSQVSWVTVGPTKLKAVFIVVMVFMITIITMRLHPAPFLYDPLPTLPEKWVDPGVLVLN